MSRDMRPAVVYIDGYNLYFGMVEAGMRSWLWIDLVDMAERIVPEGCYVAEVRYYTARVKRPPDSLHHQKLFISANQLHRPELVVIEGYMQYNPRECSHCHTSSDHREEKQTDVNMALDMALAATGPNRLHEVAVLVSADSDQVPTVNVLISSGMDVAVRFPPARNSNELKQICPDTYVISKRKLQRSQLPPSVMRPNGDRIERPSAWGRLPAGDA